MRYILTLLFINTFYLTHANDTLTRAQIYSYNIGDTFDYRNETYDFNNYTTHAPPAYSLSYTRIATINIYFSSDSLTKYIVREQLYPNAHILDTLVLTSLQQYEVSIPNYSLGTQDMSIVDSSIIFWGHLTNNIRYFAGYYYYNTYYAEGLGSVLQTWVGGTGVGGSFEDTTSLIYYSGTSGTMGTPYTNYTTAVNDISLSVDLISLYPNPASQSCTIIISNYDGESYSARLTDITGKEISSTITFASGAYTFPLSQYARGVYLLQITDSQNRQVVKKLVIE